MIMWLSISPSTEETFDPRKLGTKRITVYTGFVHLSLSINYFYFNGNGI